MTCHARFPCPGLPSYLRAAAHDRADGVVAGSRLQLHERTGVPRPRRGSGGGEPALRRLQRPRPRAAQRPRLGPRRLLRVRHRNVGLRRAGGRGWIHDPLRKEPPASRLTASVHLSTKPGELHLPTPPAPPSPDPPAGSRPGAWRCPTTRRQLRRPWQVCASVSWPTCAGKRASRTPSRECGQRPAARVRGATFRHLHRHIAVGFGGRSVQRLKIASPGRHM